MRKDDFKEKRKSSRYETEVKVYFHYPYDINAKVDYQLTDKKYAKKLSPKYTGVSKNVSAEGLCFNSGHELKGGDNLFIELHLPGEENREPILLEGTVRWCHEATESGFDTGVRLLTVNGQHVHETIYFDNKYKVEWSAVLDAVLGKYQVISKGRKK